MSLLWSFLIDAYEYAIDIALLWSEKDATSYFRLKIYKTAPAELDFNSHKVALNQKS
jgi:hypothetical protein